MSETAFGGTALCTQHHIVASVCPYCEIDRLKKEIEELEKEISKMREGFESFSEQLDRHLPLSQLVYQAKVMTDKALQNVGGK